MHQSIPTAPMPPRANPRALAFFSLEWQIPGDGDTLAAKCPAVGTKEEGKCPAPYDCTSPINTAAVFIYCTMMPLSAFLCVIFHFCRPASQSSIVCNGTI